MELLGQSGGGLAVRAGHRPPHRPRRGLRHARGRQPGPGRPQPGRGRRRRRRADRAQHRRRALPGAHRARPRRRGRPVVGHRGRPGRRRPPALRLRARRHGQGHRGRRPVRGGHRQRRRRSADGCRPAAPRSRPGDDGRRGTRRRRHGLEGPHRRRPGRARRPAHGPGRRARRLRRRLVRPDASDAVLVEMSDLERAERNGLPADGTGARRGPRQPPAAGRRDARAAAAAGRPQPRPGHRRQPGRARRLRPADGVRTGGAGGRARPGPQRHDAPRRLRDAPRRRRDGPRLARPRSCPTA